MEPKVKKKNNKKFNFLKELCCSSDKLFLL